MKEPILEVNNLRVSFRTYNGKVQAVRGIDFKLYEGETLAIVGESGSGKSVTTKAILGILPKNSIIEAVSYTHLDVYKRQGLYLECSHFPRYRVRIRSSVLQWRYRPCIVLWFDLSETYRKASSARRGGLLRLSLIHILEINS